MIGRIQKKFIDLQKNGRKAFVAYLTAGHPDLETTEKLIPALEKAGVDILEIGVPFSDPTADGPVIQASSQRALKSGVTLSNILDMIGALRNTCDIPLVLFGYYNPIFSYGNENFAKRAIKAGVDGILVVDLPPEEAQELRQYTDPAGIDFISLIAPTTTDERISNISRNASGFLYYISITGVTGTEKPVIEHVKEDVERIHKITALPLVIGFGISTPRQASEFATCADGIVIGSALVRLIEEHSGSRDLLEIASSFAREIRNVL
jgi:tryptophan synthase alpha chain